MNIYLEHAYWSYKACIVLSVYICGISHRDPKRQVSTRCYNYYNMMAPQVKVGTTVKVVHQKCKVGLHSKAKVGIIYRRDDTTPTTAGVVTSSSGRVDMTATVGTTCTARVGNTVKAATM